MKSKEEITKIIADACKEYFRDCADIFGRPQKLPLGHVLGNDDLFGSYVPDYTIGFANAGLTKQQEIILNLVLVVEDELSIEFSNEECEELEANFSKLTINSLVSLIIKKMPAVKPKNARDARIRISRSRLIPSR